MEDERLVTKAHGNRKKNEISTRGKKSAPEKWANNPKERCFLFAETSTYEDVAGVKTVFDEIGRYII